jgi:hypothetical protein
MAFPGFPQRAHLLKRLCTALSASKCPAAGRSSTGAIAAQSLIPTISILGRYWSSRRRRLTHERSCAQHWASSPHLDDVDIVNRNLREFNWVDPFPPGQGIHRLIAGLGIGGPLISVTRWPAHVHSLSSCQVGGRSVHPRGSGEDADGVGVTPRSTINSDLWTELLVRFGSAGSVLSVLLNAIQSWLERRQKGHRNN